MEMRKAVYRGSTEEGLALLARSRCVHLATTAANGRPILKTVHGVLVGNWLAFHAAPAGEKMAAIGRPAVAGAQEVVAEIPSWFLDPERACPATTYYLSVQAEGVLETIDDVDRKYSVLQALMTKYQPEGGYIPIEPGAAMYESAVRGLLVAGVRLDSVSFKAKLGQNRRLEDRLRVVERLWERGGPGDADAVDLLVRRFPELRPPFLRSEALLLSCAAQESELDEVAHLLEHAYWLAGFSRERILAAVRNSTAGVTARDREGRLVGFARAVSDGKVAWIYDVIIAPEARGSGAGTALMKLLLDHPSVRSARHVRLTTRDAETFYRRLSFCEVSEAPRRPWRSIEMTRSRA